MKREISTLIAQSSLTDDSESSTIDVYCVHNITDDLYYYMIKFMRHQFTSDTFWNKNDCVNASLDKLREFKTLKDAELVLQQMESFLC